MAETGLSRRELLERGGAGAAALLAPGLLGCARRDEREGPRIVIVGAGLAGLSCADRLQRRGVACRVFDANPERVGGRCWTSRGWANGQLAEHGGEFIDTRHRRMRALARRFGLRLDDLYAVPNPGRSRIWLDGARRRFAELSDERAIALRRLRRQAREIGRYDYGHATRAARAFDELSAAEWLDRNSPGGSRGLWGRYAWALLASEFGLDADRLSALNLVLQFIVPAPGADERFHVRGGNDQIPRALADALPDRTLTLDAPLEALARRGDRGYALRFAGMRDEVLADRVVLALPFTTLRRVDLDGAGIGRRKRACIEELGMGTNAKLLMQFERRPQAYGRWNGYLTSDDPFLLTWESTLGQPGRTSVVTTYFGGRSGAAGLAASSAHAPTVEREVRRNLHSLGQGGRTGIDRIARGFAGRAWTDRWASDPWARGSYAAYLPGQVTRFYGFAGRPEGGIHFAGEQTATTNQGYLEGAVESGERAADEVLAATGAGVR